MIIRNAFTTTFANSVFCGSSGLFIMAVLSLLAAAAPQIVRHSAAELLGTAGQVGRVATIAPGPVGAAGATAQAASFELE